MVTTKTSRANKFFEKYFLTLRLLYGCPKLVSNQSLKLTSIYYNSKPVNRSRDRKTKIKSDVTFSKTTLFYKKFKLLKFLAGRGSPPAMNSTIIVH